MLKKKRVHFCEQTPGSYSQAIFRARGIRKQAGFAVDLVAAVIFPPGMTMTGRFTDYVNRLPDLNCR